MRVGREIDRVLAALRAAIRARGLKLVEVDRRLGWPRNATSLLLRGQPRARLDHIYSILQVLDLSPEEFFQSVHGHGWVLDPALTREMLDHVEQAAKAAERLRRSSRPPVAPSVDPDERDRDA